MWNVVLIHPDIAGNTGNIGRTCLALGCRLHLVKPYGFQITDKALKRAGMDYWKQVDLKEHSGLEAWFSSIGASEQVWLVSTKGKTVLPQADFKPDCHLVFGAESAGLPPSVWERFGQNSVRIPMAEGARSINVAAAVGIVLGAALVRGG